MANLRVNKITGTEVFETTGSVQFDGNGDYLSIPTSSDFAFGTEDFTIEFFIYPTSTQDCHFYEGRALDATRRPLIRLFSGTVRYYADGADRITDTNSLNTSQWYHIAVSRSSGVSRLFVDGTSVGEYNDSIDLLAPTTNLFISTNESQNNRFFGGHISNLRVLKGTALYTKNFTPPTRELTVIPNTVLLACTSSTRANEEKTGKTITVNGNAVANELTPGLLTDRVKSGGTSAITGSVEFDGTGDYLSIPSSSDFDFGSTNDFTIECWIYQQNRDPIYYTSLFQTDGSNLGGLGLVISPGSGGILQIYRGGFVVSSTSSVPTNGWVHIAATRNSGTTRLFINGVLDGSSTISYTPTFNDIRIGLNPSSGAEKFQGFISNLRIVKGQALYTSNFTPPTRELKKIPNTVLLCCKDSSNPAAEETGKTITGYGDLQKADGIELITNGNFSNGTTGWSNDEIPILTVSGGVASVNRGGGGPTGQCYQTISTIPRLTYIVSVDVLSLSNGFQVYKDLSDLNITPSVVNSTGTHIWTFVATNFTTRLDFSAVQSTSATASFDNISVTLYDPPNRASNFTPSVGFDGTVTFDGVTKINTPNYFYLPTGNTENRGRGRGVFGGGYNSILGNTNIIDYIQIQSTGNTIDFGDLINTRSNFSSLSSSTRGIFAGGFNPASFNTIEYITISSNSNTQDFGDLSIAKRSNSSCSNSTRGIISGGFTSISLSAIEYVTIASTGDSKNFGDLSSGRPDLSSCSSPTRGIVGGGYQNINIIEYITISSTGDAQDFGDLSVSKQYLTVCSNSTRGVFGGGYTGSPTITNTNVMEYITISSTGNTQDFGDLTVARFGVAACSSPIRGVFGGGSTPTQQNVIDYVTILTTGNALDFGDLTIARGRHAACSDSHGGLS